MERGRGLELDSQQMNSLGSWIRKIFFLEVESRFLGGWQEGLIGLLVKGIGSATLHSGENLLECRRSNAPLSTRHQDELADGPFRAGNDQCVTVTESGVTVAGEPTDG